MARLTRPWWRYTAVWAGLSCLGVSINIFGHAREATGSIGMAAFFAFSAWCAIASAVLATIEIMRERREAEARSLSYHLEKAATLGPGAMHDMGSTAMETILAKDGEVICVAAVYTDPAMIEHIGIAIAAYLNQKQDQTNG